MWPPTSPYGYYGAVPGSAYGGGGAAATRPLLVAPASYRPATSLGGMPAPSLTIQRSPPAAAAPWPPEEFERNTLYAQAQQTYQRFLAAPPSAYRFVPPVSQPLVPLPLQSTQSTGGQQESVAEIALPPPVVDVTQQSPAMPVGSATGGGSAAAVPPPPGMQSPILRPPPSSSRRIANEAAEQAEKDRIAREAKEKAEQAEKERIEREQREARQLVAQQQAEKERIAQETRAKAEQAEMERIEREERERRQQAEIELKQLYAKSYSTCIELQTQLNNIAKRFNGSLSRTAQIKTIPSYVSLPASPRLYPSSTLSHVLEQQYSVLEQLFVSIYNKYQAARLTTSVSERKGSAPCPNLKADELMRVQNDISELSAALDQWLRMWFEYEKNIILWNLQDKANDSYLEGMSAKPGYFVQSTTAQSKGTTATSALIPGGPFYRNVTELPPAFAKRIQDIVGTTLAPTNLNQLDVLAKLHDLRQAVHGDYMSDPLRAVPTVTTDSPLSVDDLFTFLPKYTFEVEPAAISEWLRHANRSIMDILVGCFLQHRYNIGYTTSAKPSARSMPYALYMRDLSVDVDCTPLPVARIELFRTTDAEEQKPVPLATYSVNNTVAERNNYWVLLAAMMELIHVWRPHWFFIPDKTVKRMTTGSTEIWRTKVREWMAARHDIFDRLTTLQYTQIATGVILTMVLDLRTLPVSRELTWTWNTVTSIMASGVPSVPAPRVTPVSKRAEYKAIAERLDTWPVPTPPNRVVFLEEILKNSPSVYRWMERLQMMDADKSDVKAICATFETFLGIAISTYNTSGNVFAPIHDEWNAGWRVVHNLVRMSEWIQVYSAIQWMEIWMLESATGNVRFRQMSIGLVPHSAGRTDVLQTHILAEAVSLDVQQSHIEQAVKAKLHGRGNDMYPGVWIMQGCNTIGEPPRDLCERRFLNHYEMIRRMLTSSRLTLDESNNIFESGVGNAVEWSGSMMALIASALFRDDIEVIYVTDSDCKSIGTPNNEVSLNNAFYGVPKNTCKFQLYIFKGGSDITGKDAIVIMVYNEFRALVKGVDNVAYKTLEDEALNFTECMIRKGRFYGGSRMTYRFPNIADVRHQSPNYKMLWMLRFVLCWPQAVATAPAALPLAEYYETDEAVLNALYLNLISSDATLEHAMERYFRILMQGNDPSEVATGLVFMGDIFHLYLTFSAGPTQTPWGNVLSEPVYIGLLNQSGSAKNDDMLQTLIQTDEKEMKRAWNTFTEVWWKQLWDAQYREGTGLSRDGQSSLVASPSESMLTEREQQSRDAASATIFAYTNPRMRATQLWLTVLWMFHVMTVNGNKNGLLYLAATINEYGGQVRYTLTEKLAFVRRRLYTYAGGARNPLTTLVNTLESSASKIGIVLQPEITKLYMDTAYLLTRQNRTCWPFAAVINSSASTSAVAVESQATDVTADEVTDLLAASLSRLQSGRRKNDLRATLLFPQSISTTWMDTVLVQTPTTVFTEPYVNAPSDDPTAFVTEPELSIVLFYGDYTMSTVTDDTWRSWDGFWTRVFTNDLIMVLLMIRDRRETPMKMSALGFAIDSAARPIDLRTLDVAAIFRKYIDAFATRSGDKTTINLVDASNVLNYWLWLFLWLDMWSLQPDAMGNLINCDAWMAYVLDEKVAATREIINLRNQWICTLRGVAKDMDTKRARHVFRMMVKPTSIRATSATTSFDNNTCCWWRSSSGGSSGAPSQFGNVANLRIPLSGVNKENRSSVLSYEPLYELWSRHMEDDILYYVSDMIASPSPPMDARQGTFIKNALLWSVALEQWYRCPFEFVRAETKAETLIVAQSPAVSYPLNITMAIVRIRTRLLELLRHAVLESLNKPIDYEVWLQLATVPKPVERMKNGFFTRSNVATGIETIISMQLLTDRSSPIRTLVRYLSRFDPLLASDDVDSGEVGKLGGREVSISYDTRLYYDNIWLRLTRSMDLHATSSISDPFAESASYLDTCNGLQLIQRSLPGYSLRPGALAVAPGTPPSSSSSVVTSVVRSITSWLRPAPRKEPEPEELASDGKICGTLGSGRGLSLLNPVYVSPLVRPWVATLNKPTHGAPIVSGWDLVQLLSTKWYVPYMLTIAAGNTVDRTSHFAGIYDVTTPPRRTPSFITNLNVTRPQRSWLFLLHRRHLEPRSSTLSSSPELKYSPDNDAVGMDSVLVQVRLSAATTTTPPIPATQAPSSSLASLTGFAVESIQVLSFATNYLQRHFEPFEEWLDTWIRTKPGSPAVTAAIDDREMQNDILYFWNAVQGDSVALLPGDVRAAGYTTESVSIMRKLSVQNWAWLFAIIQVFGCTQTMSLRTQYHHILSYLNAIGLRRFIEKWACHQWTTMTMTLYACMYEVGDRLWTIGTGGQWETRYTESKRQEETADPTHLLFKDLIDATNAAGRGAAAAAATTTRIPATVTLQQVPFLQWYHLREWARHTRLQAIKYAPMPQRPWIELQIRTVYSLAFLLMSWLQAPLQSTWGVAAKIFDRPSPSVGGTGGGNAPLTSRLHVMDSFIGVLQAWTRATRLSASSTTLLWKEPLSSEPGHVLQPWANGTQLLQERDFKHTGLELAATNVVANRPWSLDELIEQLIPFVQPLLLSASDAEVSSWITNGVVTPSVTDPTVAVFTDFTSPFDIGGLARTASSTEVQKRVFVPKNCVVPRFLRALVYPTSSVTGATGTGAAVSLPSVARRPSELRMAYEMDVLYHAGTTLHTYNGQYELATIQTDQGSEHFWTDLDSALHDTSIRNVLSANGATDPKIRGWMSYLLHRLTQPLAASILLETGPSNDTWLYT